MPKAFVVMFAVSGGFLCLGLLLFLWPRLAAHVKCYVVLPLKGRGEVSRTSEPLSDLELGRLPQGQRDALELGTRRLGAHRFSLATRGRIFDDTTWGAVAVLMNERDGASALVMALRTELPDLRPLLAEVENFCTEFTDGTAIVTTNMGAGCFRPDPLCDTVRWPGMRNLDVLYRLHAARVARWRGDRHAKLPTRDAALGYMIAMDAKTLWRQVEAGDMWFDARDGVFRRTLKGSFVMTWRLLWPWKDRAAAANELKLRRELRELAMGAPEDYSPDPADDALPTLDYTSPSAV